MAWDCSKVPLNGCQSHPNERIPHMGWAPLKVERNCPLLHNDDPIPWVYFVHSYAAVPLKSSAVGCHRRLRQRRRHSDGVERTDRRLPISS
jgi:imidazoleglycerol phosphate synthase glutamine amidotransferase subunit HisH